VAASAMAAVLRSGNLCPELEGIALEDSERIAGRMARQARVPRPPDCDSDMCQRQLPIRVRDYSATGP
jgi:hypothetical protein